MSAASVNGHAVPEPGRALAARLSGLFVRDVEIVERLNDAQRCVREANERLWSGLSPDAFGLVYDGAARAGISRVAVLGARGSQTELLGALQEIHWAIHRGFGAYRDACEERRRLAVDVGGLSAQLTDALCAAGWSADDAQDADVH
jgi:hypothetical protein